MPAIRDRAVYRNKPQPLAACKRLHRTTRNTHRARLAPRVIACCFAVTLAWATVAAVADQTWSGTDGSAGTRSASRRVTDSGPHRVVAQPAQPLQWRTATMAGQGGQTTVPQGSVANPFLERSDVRFHEAPRQAAEPPARPARPVPSRNLTDLPPNRTVGTHYPASPGSADRRIADVAPSSPPRGPLGLPPSQLDQSPARPLARPPAGQLPAAPAASMAPVVPASRGLGHPDIRDTHHDPRHGVATSTPPVEISTGRLSDMRRTPGDWSRPAGPLPGQPPHIAAPPGATYVVRDGRLYAHTSDAQPARPAAVTRQPQRPAPESRKPSWFARLTGHGQADDTANEPAEEVLARTAESPQLTQVPAATEPVNENRTLVDRVRSIKMPKWMAFGRSDSEQRR